MNVFFGGGGLVRLTLMLLTAVFLAGCGGVQAPCTDDDPVGPCATSHSRTYGG